MMNCILKSFTLNKIDFLKRLILLIFTTNGDYGIHGTNNPSSIGKAVSNGCIRTYNNNIIELYNLVPIGTPVGIM